MTEPLLYYGHDGISVITCTKRPGQMDALLRNYGRQNYRNKELIIILNHPGLRLYDYMRAAQAYLHVRIFSLPAHVPLGACLNAGVNFARYGLIAKFDDDDYYASGYLADSRRLMLESRAAIVGKRAHYMYLAGRKQLLLRYPKRAGRYVDQVQGATLLVKREVLEQVKFPELNRGGMCEVLLPGAGQGLPDLRRQPLEFPGHPQRQGRRPYVEDQRQGTNGTKCEGTEDAGCAEVY